MWKESTARDTTPKNDPNSEKNISIPKLLGSNNNNCPAWKKCFVSKRRRILSHIYKHNFVEAPYTSSSNISRNQCETYKYDIKQADQGSDDELLITKFRLKLKKTGKTTTPFRYDLNQIPYSYAVEVTNRFKVLDLINTVPEELWMEVCDTVQETGIKTIPKKNKSKMVV